MNSAKGETFVDEKIGLNLPLMITMSPNTPFRITTDGRNIEKYSWTRLNVPT